MSTPDSESSTVPDRSDDHTLRNAAAETVRAVLPDPDDDIVDDPDARATLHFQSEAWIDGRARNTEQECTFEIPLADLRTPENEWGIDPTPAGHYVDDALATHDNAPDWVRHWRGPFTLSVDSWARSTD